MITAIATTAFARHCEHSEYDSSSHERNAFDRVELSLEVQCEYETSELELCLPTSTPRGTESAACGRLKVSAYT